MTKSRETIVSTGLLGLMVAAVLALFFSTHYQAFLNPGAAQSVAAGSGNSITIPTIDEMCTAAGATSANMASCQADENAAGEFVIAWMGYNGFLANGTIDMAQIQLAADLGPDAVSPLTNPDPGLVDSGLDPAFSDPGLDGSLDPQTGLPIDQTFETPAQIAMFCLSSSMDWIQMHDCISRNDPSTQFTGN